MNSTYSFPQYSAVLLGKSELLVQWKCNTLYTIRGDKRAH